MSVLRPRQARRVYTGGAGGNETKMSRSVRVEKSYQDLFRFCWKMGGVRTFEEAMIQWDLNNKVSLSPSMQAALKRRCEWLGLPQP